MARIPTHDLALLVLRACGLGLALAHGLPKVIRLATGQGAGFVAGVAELGFPAPELFAWAAALAELVGGLLVAVGLATQVAAAFAAVTMAVASFVRHKAHAHLAAKLGVLAPGEATVESWGNPEKALVYLAVFVALMLVGGGRYSLDAWWKQRRHRASYGRSRRLRR